MNMYIIAKLDVSDLWGTGFEKYHYILLNTNEIPYKPKRICIRTEKLESILFLKGIKLEPIIGLDSIGSMTKLGTEIPKELFDLIIGLYV